jgi:hypothetical protein
MRNFGGPNIRSNNGRTPYLIFLEINWVFPYGLVIPIYIGADWDEDISV